MMIIDKEYKDRFFRTGIQKRYALALDEIVQVRDRPPGRVVGIDLYTLTDLLGERRRWVSYTVEGPLHPGGKKTRYGITIQNGFGSLVCDVFDGEIPQTAHRLDHMSGAVYTKVFGDAVQQSPYGTLLVSYDTHKSIFYAEEIFHGTRPLKFVSKRQDLKTFQRGLGSA